MDERLEAAAGEAEPGLGGGGGGEGENVPKTIALICLKPRNSDAGFTQPRTILAGEDVEQTWGLVTCIGGKLHSEIALPPMIGAGRSG